MSSLINAAKAAEMLGISKRKVYDLAQKCPQAPYSISARSASSSPARLR